MEPIQVFLIVGGGFLLLVVVLVRRVPQGNAAIVERFGRYTRTLNAGLNILVPFVDQVCNRIDLREQIVVFPPEEVLTQEHLVVGIDAVVYYQVTDARAVTYEVADYLEAIGQLFATTLRDIIGGMDLDRVLHSRVGINAALRGVLDEATGKWGIRVNRIELRDIELPAVVRKARARQMRADSDKRVAILRAEGERYAAILRAEAEREAALLRARTEREVAGMLADRHRP